MSSIEPHPHSNFAGSLALLCALVVAAPLPAHAAGGGRMEFQFALLQTGRSMTCATDSRNFGHTFSRLQDEVESTGHEVLWFSIKDRPYVIRDSSTVERAHRILEPMTRLGTEQGRVGSMQAELGAQQARASRLAFAQLRGLADQAIASGKAEAIGSD
jgi:hypothetical protein